MSEQVFGPLLGIVATLTCGWLLVSGFKRGEMEWPYVGLNLSGRREDQPLRFWAVTGCLILWGTMFLIGTLLMIFFPNGL